MDVTDAIHTRRAYRSLAPVTVDAALVADLASHAQLSASCFNNQPWRYVFVSDPLVLEQMRSVMSKGNEWTFAASMIIAVVGRPDFDCVMKDGRRYYAFDVGMATAFLILRATELGLVAHPIAGYGPAKVREVLGIPDNMEVLTLVNVGRRAETLSPVLSDKQIEDEGRRPPRKPLDEFAFSNRWPEGYDPPLPAPKP
jgi:nitroreductase